jgi:hypothetical protein
MASELLALNSALATQKLAPIEPLVKR